MGLMVVLAMSAAVLVGGGELLVVEAAVSAILLVALDPAAADGFSPNRILEALIGGGAALAVTSMFFPPDPALEVGRAVQAVFAQLGRTLERIAGGLLERDAGMAESGLADARGIDTLVAHVRESLATSRETARLAPPRRASRAQLDRYERCIAQLDFAVRNTRMLARHALRLARGGDVPEDVPAAVRELVAAIWELAAAFDDPRRAADARRLAVAAAGRAADLLEPAPDIALTELLGQVRSTAVDLVRAADLVTEPVPDAATLPTEELLVGAS
jgi:hypothetical protein